MEKGLGWIWERHRTAELAAGGTKGSKPERPRGLGVCWETSLLPDVSVHEAAGEERIQDQLLGRQDPRPVPGGICILFIAVGIILLLEFCIGHWWLLVSCFAFQLPHSPIAITKWSPFGLKSAFSSLEPSQQRCLVSSCWCPPCRESALRNVTRVIQVSLDYFLFVSRSPKNCLPQPVWSRGSSKQ